MSTSLKLGIAGGAWATLAGLIFFIWLLVSPGFTASPAFWMVSSNLLLIVISGSLSVLTILKRSKWPRPATSVVWTAVAAIVFASFLGAGVWDIFVLPGAFLLLPAAFKLSSSDGATSPANYALAGVIWAFLCGLMIFSIVILPAVLRGQRWPQLMFPSILIMVGAVLSLTGLLIRNKMPVISVTLMCAGILGIALPLFFGLSYFSLYIFPALVTLVLSGVWLWRKPGGQDIKKLD